MLPHTAQWVERAEVDWISATALRRTKDERVVPVICFLSHSTVEKYIKAWLVENGVEPPRSHYLVPLIDLLPQEAPLWPHLGQGLDELTPYAILGRYLGEELDGEDAKFARRLAREVRSLIRERLGLG